MICLYRPNLSISETEKMILLYLSGGLLAKEIAEEMNLKRRTVESWIITLRKRYGAKNTAHLVSIAFRKYLIS